MINKKVLDSYALLAFFQDEPGADLVEKILIDAEYGHAEVYLCVINWGEIYYTIKRRLGDRIAEEKIEEIEHMAINIVSADKILTGKAAKIKANFSMSYADSFAAALSQMKDAELITGDKEFKSVEKEIKIIWI
jgi:predicted nucleic acid-binding protein